MRWLPGCVLLTVAVVATNATAQNISLGLNFTGTNLNLSGFRPPDTMGTVGPNHIVELINGRYRVYDKTTGSSQRNWSLNTFWQLAGAPHAGNFAFDPRVQYDPQTDRYFATSVDNAAGPNNILVAVSDTNNPLDGWTGFSIDSDTDNQQWADFPQMGFSNDALVISNNMFGLNGGDFEVNVLTIPKADLVAAVPTIANATLLEDQFASAGFNFSLQPSIDPAGSGRPLRLFTTDSSAQDEVEVVQLNDPLGSPSLVSLPAVGGLTNYPSPPLAEQPGPKQNLDSGGRRTRSAVTLIGDHYYGIHGVEVAGRAAQRWYKIDADTLQLAEEGVIADPTMDFIYGSIAANEMGDVVVGFTGSSEEQFPSAYAAVGGTDPNTGTLSFDAPILLKEGVSDYLGLVGTRNRWGDYSATVVDPENPRTFWTFQEFVSSTDNWSVQITEIILSISGDFNGDGVYDCADVDDLVVEIVAGNDPSEFDLTGDGLVDQADLAAWLVEAGDVNLGAPYLVGDADLNGVVDGQDFVTWNASKFTVHPAWCAGDFTADGLVDGQDFIAWNDNKFTSSTVPPVPEPSHGWLSLLGGLLVWSQIRSARRVAVSGPLVALCRNGL